MWRFVLALFVLAGVGAAAWLMVNDSTGLAEAGGPREAAQATRTDGAVALQAPAADPIAAAEVAQARVEAAPPPPPPEPQGFEDGAPPSTPNADFSWKYAQHEDGELEARLADLDRELKRTLDREFASAFKNGDYVEHGIAPDDRRSVEQLMHDFDGGDPLCRAQILSSSNTSPDGTPTVRYTAAQVACLSRDAHPHLASMLDEQRWLRSKLSDRR